MISILKKILCYVVFIFVVSVCFFFVIQVVELLIEGVFKVGMEVIYLLFEFYDSNNNIVGFDLEFVVLIV